MTVLRAGLAGFSRRCGTCAGWRLERWSDLGVCQGVESVLSAAVLEPHCCHGRFQCDVRAALWWCIDSSRPIDLACCRTGAVASVWAEFEVYG